MSKDRFSITPEQAQGLPENWEAIVTLLSALPQELGRAVEDVLFMENLPESKITSSDPTQPPQTLQELIQAQATETE